MCRCFKLQVQGNKNVYTETWIRVSKLSQKNFSRSEDVDKIQTKFL